MAVDELSLTTLVSATAKLSESIPLGPWEKATLVALEDRVKEVDVPLRAGVAEIYTRRGDAMLHSDFATVDKSESEELALREASYLRISLLLQEATSFGQEVLRQAEKYRSLSEERYGHWTSISIALYFLGWGLTFLGRLTSLNPSETED